MRYVFKSLFDFEVSESSIKRLKSFCKSQSFKYYPSLTQRKGGEIAGHHSGTNTSGFEFHRDDPLFLGIIFSPTKHHVFR